MQEQYAHLLDFKPTLVILSSKQCSVELIESGNVPAFSLCCYRFSPATAAHLLFTMPPLSSLSQFTGLHRPRQTDSPATPQSRTLSNQTIHSTPNEQLKLLFLHDSGSRSPLLQGSRPRGGRATSLQVRPATYATGGRAPQ